MIGPTTSVKGRITGDEDLTVQGTVEGSLKLSKNLTVEKGATVNASVDAVRVILSGELTGTVDASEHIRVDAGASLIGDVNCPKIAIAEGAHFEGRIDMPFDIPSID